MIRLIDSTYMIKDSIMNVEKYMDSLDKSDLDKIQKGNYITTMGLLVMMKLKLDFNLDRERLNLLKEHVTSLEGIIKKFDKKIKKLSALTDRLTSLTKFINISIAILSTAIF